MKVRVLLIIETHSASLITVAATALRAYEGNNENIDEGEK